MQTHFRVGSQLRERAAGGIHAYVSKCRDCELGRDVAERLGGKALPPVLADPLA